jgi:hypothetical protein
MTDKTEEEQLDVLYSTCYGGFGISKEALKRYNEKLLQKNPDAKVIKYDMDIRRHDPILIEVFHEMDGENCERGEGFNSKFSKASIETIPMIYKQYYHIDDYDGKEGIIINYHGFMVDEYKRIANDESLTYEERILKIQKLEIKI